MFPRVMGITKIGQKAVGHGNNDMAMVQNEKSLQVDKNTGRDLRRSAQTKQSAGIGKKAKNGDGKKHEQIDPEYISKRIKYNS